MSRTLKFKLAYAFVLVASLGLGFALHAAVGSAAILVVALLLFVPGRIGRIYLQELFQSRHHLAREEFSAAQHAAEVMLVKLEREPWRRYLMGCFFGIYTWSAEAMARNNLGAARMMLGAIDEGDDHFNKALVLDPDYPLPYFNKAVVEMVRGNKVESDRLVALAAAKGFRSTTSDKIVQAVAAAHARIQK